jgi:DNA topoisomerase-1
MMALDHHPWKLAQAADLRYVKDSQPGIRRKRKGKGWSYSVEGRAVRDKVTLERIHALAIPPAWREVWICTAPEGHLQATGVDAKGRKQYLYHKRWASVRGQVKYHRLHGFGLHLPRLRKQVAKDLRKKGLPQEKVLAGVVALMERTRIRIGNSHYEHANGSFELSTMKDRHVKRDRNGTRLRFKGKSGIVHDIPLHSAKLARLVVRCKELPGQELFQYEDGEGKVHHVDSGMVNDYIREAAQGDFTSKDLRTWMGTGHCIRTLLEIGPAETVNDCRQKVNAALDAVALHLGNTRAVCRRSYVDPRVINCYERGELRKYAQGVSPPARTGPNYSHEELVLMKMLKDPNVQRGMR